MVQPYYNIKIVISISQHSINGWCDLISTSEGGFNYGAIIIAGYDDYYYVRIYK